MSRQSKNTRNLARAAVYTAMHLKGEKGASKTTPQHGKKWTYRHNPDAMKKLAEFLKSSSVDTKATGAKAILSKAGGAAK